MGVPGHLICLFKKSGIMNMQQELNQNLEQLNGSKVCRSIDYLIYNQIYHKQYWIRIEMVKLLNSTHHKKK